VHGGHHDRPTHARAPIDELKKYAEERGLEVGWTDDDELVFDGSIENQWSILKLLDEDRPRDPSAGAPTTQQRRCGARTWTATDGEQLLGVGGAAR
jgi:hypothetical protein